MDDGSVIFADDVDTKLLACEQKQAHQRESVKPTTMSSLFSSYGSLSTPSGERRTPLMNVPFEDLTSLMKIFNSQSTSQQQLWCTDLAPLFPNLGVSSGEDFGVEVGIAFTRNCLSVRLAANLDLDALALSSYCSKGNSLAVLLEGGSSSFGMCPE